MDSNNQSAINKKLYDLRRKEEEERAKLLAKKLGLRYINLVMTPIELEALGIIIEEEARAGQMAVIKKDYRKLYIAVLESNNPTTQSTIKSLNEQGYATQLYIVSPFSLNKALEYYKELAPSQKNITGRIEISNEFLASVKQEIKTINDLRAKIKSIAPFEASQIVEIVIAGALNTDASDIHFEPKEKETLLRYRLDGLLHDIITLPAKTYKLILSRIKLMSEMKLNIRDIAQDGRFTVRLNETDIENRVSVLPGPNGENIVIRILDPKALRPGLKDLGLRSDLYEIIEKQIARPNGMLITTGPTGSGKTTALYAFLKARVSPEIKIITLEDPIEYHLEGIVQTQVESEHGYTFASGLRSILRQDPDIILVGEIRDNETAETAVNAALTGHLVFSTLHTNDAAGAIPRFVELGARPAILSSALNMAMAQRLVRRICPNCKEEFEPDEQAIKKIRENLKNISPKLYPVDIAKPFKLYRGKGCELCDNVGYKGRIGLFELVAIDHEMEKIVSQSPSHAEMLDIIMGKGIMLIYQDGLFKVLEGITTIEELETIASPVVSE